MAKSPKKQNQLSKEHKDTQQQKQPSKQTQPKQPESLPSRFYITPLVILAIIILTILNILGVISNQLNAIFTSFSLIITYFQWALPLSPSQFTDSNNKQRQPSGSPKYILQNFKRSKVARWGMIAATFFIIASIVLVILQPWPHSTSIPYPPGKGILVLNDPLSSNDNNKDWPVGEQTYGFCQFIGLEYHVSENQEGYSNTCLAKTPQFTDFVYQVEMTILKGAGGGIIFRAENIENYYELTITPFILAAHYQLGLVANGKLTSLVQNGLISPSFFTAGGSNLVAIVATGESITFYMNEIKIFSKDDGGYSKGHIGVFAISLNSQQDEYITSQTSGPSEVSFRDAKIWTI